MMHVYSIAIRRTTGSMGIDDSGRRIKVTLKERDYSFQAEVIPPQLFISFS